MRPAASDLLWSAYGINRPTGDRTAPYWRHVMVIDVYAILYDPKRHALILHLQDNLRAKTGLQDFVASINLAARAPRSKPRVGISPRDLAYWLLQPWLTILLEDALCLVPGTL